MHSSQLDKPPRHNFLLPAHVMNNNEVNDYIAYVKVKGSRYRPGCGPEGG